MLKTTRKFNNIDEVREFVNEIAKESKKCDVKCGSFEIDGESLMGMISLIGKECEITVYD